MGYSRKLNGVPVRSLKVRRQAEQRNLWYPSVVYFRCSLVVADVQCGQFKGHSS